MSRVKRKRSKRKTVFMLLAEILCLSLVVAASYKMLAGRVEKQNEEPSQKESVRQEAPRQEEVEDRRTTGELDQWNLMLVNNHNAIPDDYDPELVDIEDGYSVDARIKEPLEAMLADCRAAGYSPQIISAYRSHETQQYLYDSTANKADTAVPGHSEHECGLAVDIIDSESVGWADPLVDEQETMPTQKWLMEHCQDYGFILRYPRDKEEITEIVYEPWHYRYVGEEHAKTIMEDHICLEEYIGTFH